MQYREAAVFAGTHNAAIQGSTHARGEWTQRGRDVREALAQFQQAYGSNFNIGVLTGPASGVLVIDVDPKSGGLETLASWVEEHGPLPKTLTVLTGRFGDVRGKHLYFRYPLPMARRLNRGQQR